MKVRYNWIPQEELARYIGEFPLEHRNPQTVTEEVKAFAKSQGLKIADYESPYGNKGFYINGSTLKFVKVRDFNQLITDSFNKKDVDKKSIVIPFYGISTLFPCFNWWEQWRLNARRKREVAEYYYNLGR